MRLYEEGKRCVRQLLHAQQEGREQTETLRLLKTASESLCWNKLSNTQSPVCPTLYWVILPWISPSIHPSSTKNSLWEDFFTYMWIKCSRYCSFIIVLINLHLGSYSSRTNTNTFLTNPMLLVSAGPLFFFHLPFPFWMSKILLLEHLGWPPSLLCHLDHDKYSKHHMCLTPVLYSYCNL